MGTVTVNNTFYGYSSGWYNRTFGNASYIQNRGTSSYATTVQPMVVSPSTGYTINAISLTYGLVGGTYNNTVISYANAFNSLDNAKNGARNASYTTGHLGSGSTSITANSQGKMCTINMTGFNISSTANIYVVVSINQSYMNGALAQYWTKNSGYVTGAPTAAITAEKPLSMVKICTNVSANTWGNYRARICSNASANTWSNYQVRICTNPSANTWINT